MAWNPYYSGYTSPPGGGIDYGQLVSEAIQTAGSVLTHSPTVPAYDPRYRQYPQVVLTPEQIYRQQQEAAAAQFRANPDSVSGKLTIKTETLLLIGLGVVLFVLGTNKKGR